MSAHGERLVILPGPADVAAFRREARRLLMQGVPPQAVQWQVADHEDPSLFGSGGASVAVPADVPSAAAPSGPPVPSAFVQLLSLAALHREPQRFMLLYTLLWRIVHEPQLRHDPLDPQMLRARGLAQQVQHEMHKTKAFVRFREVPDADGCLHVAWFEPRHHVVEAVAPFFARRFAQMRWALLTPLRCVSWDGAALRFGPGVRREEAPAADAGESLWLTYYASIFNPARLKLATMQREMPRRYWGNLPESVLIAPLAAQAAMRTGQMVAQAATVPARRRGAASLAATKVVVEASARPDPPALGALDDAQRTQRLASLRRATDRCRECPIGEHATQSVVGEGPLRPWLMLVGEQPGDQEDLRGQPFVGPAGKVLERGLAELGWPRDRLYLTNAVKHFKFEPRGKRRMHKTPAQREIEACAHWLEDEIALAQPQAIVALGATAARSLLGRAVPVLANRGQWLQRSDGLRVLVTLHPSALLRADPQQRESAYALWLADLRQAGTPP